MAYPKYKSMPSREHEQLHPLLQAKLKKFLAECAKYKIPVIVTQTYRTHEYQHELYEQGRSKPGKIVTKCDSGTSMHEFRLAFDICINIKGSEYNKALLWRAARIGQKCGLISGADWNGNGSMADETFLDMPHFEYLGGLTHAQIRKGKLPKK